MSDEPIKLDQEFRAAKVDKIIFENEEYIVIRIYLQGHNRDWYETTAELSKKGIKEVGR